MLKAAHAYLKTQINTTSQGEILLMLYDGAIKFLVQAKERIQAKDYAQKGILISKALDVIAELDGSLNAEKGGELAQNLHKLYFYCNTRLLRANLEMNEEFVDEVIKIMEAMRSAFKEITSAEGAMPEGQAPVTEAAARARADLEAVSKAPAASAAYGPGMRAAASSVPEDVDAGTDDDVDLTGEERQEAAQAEPAPKHYQNVPTRKANLRMVAKLKAYHQAGS